MRPGEGRRLRLLVAGFTFYCSLGVVEQCPSKPRVSQGGHLHGVPNPVKKQGLFAVQRRWELHEGRTVVDDDTLLSFVALLLW
jgi:hypothetical protein